MLHLAERSEALMPADSASRACRYVALRHDGAAQPAPQDLIAEIPVLEAFRLRCEARPAFQKALAEQMATFAEHAPPAG